MQGLDDVPDVPDVPDVESEEISAADAIHCHQESRQIINTMQQLPLMKTSHFYYLTLYKLKIIM
ncbi:MAG: hypothetical protein ABJH06_18335 [Paraglaciecola sp.]|uniref:hypothetical protein n=1 Tax=Paraglaciecola sp. TaxID=1920173 RepID=UPI0032979CDF